MAKSKRKRVRSARTKQASAGFLRKYLKFVILGGLLALAGYGYFVSQDKATAYTAFADLAAQGKPALTRVEVRPSEGRNHVRAGQQVFYGTNPPTSGPHYANSVAAGFYETVKGRSNLVHSLEHGLIVIYYDAPGDAAMATLREWTGLFAGQWSGIVSVRRAGLGEKVILTAWRRTLRLNRFDEKSAAAFIDAFRGRGPEKQVR